MNKILSILTVSLTLAASALAENITWSGTSSDYWRDARNWRGNHIPGRKLGDEIILTTAGTSMISRPFNPNHSVNITVRNGMTLTIKSSLSNIDTFRIGHNKTHHGIVNQTKGTVSTRLLAIGSSPDAAASEYNVNGTALLNATESIIPRYTGELNLYGGSVTTPMLDLQNGGSVNLTAGSLNATTLMVGMAKGGTFTQSGSSTVSSAAISIGEKGTYALNGGTLINRGYFSNNNRLNINGGTLTIDNDAAAATLSGPGTIAIKSGILNNTGIEVTNLLHIKNNIEISGGTITLQGQNRILGEFKVIGSNAAIIIKRLNRGAGSFVFEFNKDDRSGGKSLSKISSGGNTYIALDTTSITVDGSNYQGGPATITLFETVGVGLVSGADECTVKNLPAGLTGSINQDKDAGLITLTIKADANAVPASNKSSATTIAIIGIAALLLLLVCVKKD